MRLLNKGDVGLLLEPLQSAVGGAIVDDDAFDLVGDGLIKDASQGRLYVGLSIEDRENNRYSGLRLHGEL